MPATNLEEKRRKAREAGYTDAQIAAYEKSRGIGTTNNTNSSTTNATVPTVNKPSNQGSTAKSILDNGEIFGSFLGGFLGPFGTAAGYSLGNSANVIGDQLENGGRDLISNIIGQNRGLKMTDFGNQRAAEEGMQDFNYGREAINNIVSGGMDTAKDLYLENLSRTAPAAIASLLGFDLPNPESAGGEFIKDNVQGATIAGLTDKLVGNASDLILSKLFPKVFGPAAKVSGIKPSTIEASADELSTNAWNQIQNALDAGTGKDTIAVPGLLDDLQRQLNNLSKGFDNKALPERIVERQKGIQSVIDDLTRASTNQGIDSIGPGGSQVMEFDPQAVQTLKSTFGKEAFNPVRGTERVFSGLFESAEQGARKQAGAQLRDALIGYLEQNGVKDAAKLFDEYATGNKIARSASQGFGKYATEGSFTPTTIGGLAGGPLAFLTGNPAAFGIAPLLYAAMAPYGQQLSREALKLPVRALDLLAAPVAAGVYSEYSN